MARDFKFDGIKYCVVDENAKTCRASERNKVASIVILPELVYDANTPYTLIEIGDFSFIDCDSLPHVIMPDSVKTMENCAFRSSQGLKELYLSNSLTTISVGTFSLCFSEACFNWQVRNIH